eukprot:TRINITY_DN1283_c0_g1_i1.p1 TRINITY_DN1283_c0_g1~~TRINITY_DN1283_c0_g1_i1.p1  ORF type:complete len:111 (+),score=8.15 TRINITY_DN1283_c0_g1_i1:2663-2995(+)
MVKYFCIRLFKSVKQGLSFMVQVSWLMLLDEIVLKDMIQVIIVGLVFCYTQSNICSASYLSIHYRDQRCGVPFADCFYPNQCICLSCVAAVNLGIDTHPCNGRAMESNLW